MTLLPVAVGVRKLEVAARTDRAEIFTANTLGQMLAQVRRWANLAECFKKLKRLEHLPSANWLVAVGVRVETTTVDKNTVFR